MIGWLILGGFLVFLFGGALIALDVRENGTLSVLDDALKLEGWMPILVCIFGILMASYGVGN